MTDLKYNKLVTRIFWFALPILIGFFTWIVITLYSVNTKTDIGNTQGMEREKLQEKIWVMLQENNTLLSEKADEKTNVAQHIVLMNEIKELDRKLVKLEYSNKQMIKSLTYSSYPKYDSVFFTKSEEIKVPNPKETNILDDSAIIKTNENIWANLFRFSNGLR